MAFWLAVLEGVRIVLFASAHFLGGSIGAGILALSLLARIALIPWTLPAARRAQAYRDELARASKDKPPQVPAFSGVTLAQLPIGIAMYQTIRQASGSFLWIRDLARPDTGLAIIAAVVAAFAAKFSAADKQSAAMLVSAAITLAVIWHLASGVALYSIAWSGVSAAESWLARRKQ